MSDEPRRGIEVAKDRFTCDMVMGKALRTAPFERGFAVAKAHGYPGGVFHENLVLRLGEDRVLGRLRYPKEHVPALMMSPSGEGTVYMADGVALVSKLDFIDRYRATGWTYDPWAWEVSLLADMSFWQLGEVDSTRYDARGNRADYGGQAMEWAQRRVLRALHAYRHAHRKSPEVWQDAVRAALLLSSTYCEELLGTQGDRINAQVACHRARTGMVAWTDALAAK